MENPRVVILCGGRGGRMGELTTDRPKPMVEIGGQPILWHIMRHYGRHGFRHFVIALGYFGWAAQWYLKDQGNFPADWIVQPVATGWCTQNGGRLKRLASYLSHEPFLMSWGDGVSDIDLEALLAFHRAHGKLCTVAAVHPPERFGALEIDAVGGRVVKVTEKGLGGGWINAGFLACEPGVLDYIDGDQTQWEFEPMQRLAANGQLVAFMHTGFWQCMDTPRDMQLLNELWAAGAAPWKTWED